MTLSSSPLRAVRRCSSIVALSAAACSGGDGGTAPPKPAAVQSLQASTPTATVGTALATAPTFTVTDASGTALGNVSVTITVTGGGGTLVGAPAKSSAGPTPVGTWTLGTTAGTNTLSITVSGVAPVTISATGTPGNPAKIVVASGNAQTALAGAQAATALGAAVQDQFGNGVANVQVTFQVTAGGGLIVPGLLSTNASGVAAGALWRLGNKGGAQTATATGGGFTANFSATVQSSFPLDLRFFGTPMSLPAQTAFTNAANRLRAAIITQISGVQLQNTDISQCGVNGLTGSLTETTTGIIIYASVAPIDGAGKILAQAGPCFVRNSSTLPVIGVMQFDEADIQNYITSGRFEAVVLHEMNHVLGFGTIWTDKGLLSGAVFTDEQNPTPTGNTNPRFTGNSAVAACVASGGLSTHCTSGVAVEQCGGSGTADGHWREVFTSSCSGQGNTPGPGTPAFDTELMTGYAESSPNMPWSAMTISSFQDLGYSVNTLAADSYTVPNLLALARASLQDAATSDRAVEIVHRPRFTVTGGGRVQAINRERK